MAYEAIQQKLGTLKAGADLRTHQYKAVKIVADGDVELATEGTDAVLGVLQNTPNTNETAEVCVFGVTKYIASGALTPGAVIGGAKPYARVIEGTSGAGVASIFVGGQPVA